MYHGIITGGRMCACVCAWRAGRHVQVAREAYDPLNPDNKKSLINNITTSAKETSQVGPPGDEGHRPGRGRRPAGGSCGVLPARLHLDHAW